MADIMKDEFMTIRKVTVPILTAILLASQLTGCTISVKEMVALIDSNQSITIELVEPTSYAIKVKAGTISSKALDWIALDRNKSFDSLRVEMDLAFNINTVTVDGLNGKAGVLYVDETGDRNSNTTLEDAVRNKVFVEKYWDDGAIKTKLMGISSEAYTDTLGTDTESLMATLNAYYDIIPDSESPDSFNGTQSLTREEWSTLLYRATTPVDDEMLANYDPTTDKFTLAVGGETTMTAYAKEMDKYAWLKTGNKSLDAATYKGEITRAEAVYMIAQVMFKDKYDEVASGKKAKLPEGTPMFSDVKNYGDLALDAKYKTNDKKTKTITPKDRWEAYTIEFMTKNPDKGMQEELYKGMVVAASTGFLDATGNKESRWDEPISKTEAIQLIVNACLAANKEYGYASEVEYGVSNADKFSKEAVLEKEEAEKPVDIVSNPSENPDGKDENGYTMYQYIPQPDGSLKDPDGRVVSGADGAPKTDTTPKIPEGFTPQPDGTYKDKDGNTIVFGDGEGNNIPSIGPGSETPPSNETPPSSGGEDPFGDGSAPSFMETVEAGKKNSEASKKDYAEDKKGYKYNHDMLEFN